MLYQMWMINHSTASSLSLAQQTEAEREATLKALIAAHVDSGARPLLRCTSGWTDEQHPWWGGTSFPNLESRIKQYQLISEYGFLRSNEPTFTLLGTALEEPRLDSIQPGLIYCLWMIRSDPAASVAYKSLSEEEKEQLWEKVGNTMNRLDGCWIIRCNAYWANDAYQSFGVEAFPSLEAIQEYKAELQKLDWPIYLPATSILGTLDLDREQIKQIFG
jgi:hypothetical protein